MTWVGDDPDYRAPPAGYVVTPEELDQLEQRLAKPWDEECSCDVCARRRRDHELIAEIRRRPL